MFDCLLLTSAVKFICVPQTLYVRMLFSLDSSFSFFTLRQKFHKFSMSYDVDTIVQKVEITIMYDIFLSVPEHSKLLNDWFNILGA